MEQPWSLERCAPLNLPKKQTCVLVRVKSSLQKNIFTTSCLFESYYQIKTNLQQLLLSLFWFTTKQITGLSLRAVPHNTCYAWVHLIFPWWNCLLLIEFSHKGTSLLWVWRMGLQVSLNDNPSLMHTVKKIRMRVQENVSMFYFIMH